MITRKLIKELIQTTSIVLDDYDYNDETGEEMRQFKEEHFYAEFGAIEIHCHLTCTESYRTVNATRSEPTETHSERSDVRVENFSMMYCGIKIDRADLLDFAYRVFVESIEIE